jgi:HupE / UreJ protein
MATQIASAMRAIRTDDSTCQTDFNMLRLVYALKRVRTIAGVFVVIGLLAMPAFAHEIPNDVMVQAFVKPSGQRLQMLIRVPLAAMRDVDFPTTSAGYLDLDRVGPLLPDAATLWISDAVDLYENGSKVGMPRVVETRVSLPSDKSFTSFDEALAHVSGPPLPAGSNVFWNQVLFDVLFEYEIQSDRSRFSIRPAFDRLGVHVVTALRFLAPDTPVRAFEFTDDPGLIRLDPRWHQAALRFIQLGFFHILDGTDHLLFLFCLVIPFRRFRALIPVVTAFTVAHSMTLIASAYDFAPDALWFPPLIETLIAVSIVYMALENIAGGAVVHRRWVQRRWVQRRWVQRRWIVAFGFGLVHGFGFSFALRQTMQFAGSHLLTSLLSFNLGVELGQLAVLAVMIPLLDLLFRYVVKERMGTIILSALVAHTGWHWMVERWERLRQFRFTWPEFNAAWLASAMHWMIAALLVVGVIWLVSGLMRHRETA